MNSYKMISGALLEERSKTVNLWKLREWLENLSPEAKETLDSLSSYVFTDAYGFRGKAILLLHGNYELAKKFTDIVRLPINRWETSFDGTAKAVYDVNDEIEMRVELELPEDLVIEKVKRSKCSIDSYATEYVIKSVGQVLSEVDDEVS